MTNKLIVLMIDGVAAQHYAADRERFPNLASLEARGTRVNNLHSEVLGTSLPGRTSMLTGVTADLSGVYGNKIWDPKLEAFRYANPDDIGVPTIPKRAKDAGKQVAVMGFGMIRPEDAHIYKAPWWVGEFVQRARDAEPEAADHAWVRAGTHQTDPRFQQVCEAAGVPHTLPQMDPTDPAVQAYGGFIADHQMLDWVGVLAASDLELDLIIAEFLMTDTIQHRTGYRSAISQYSVEQADMAVGRVLRRLEDADKLDEWNIAVMSDHGHSTVTQAVHPQVLFPDARYQTEGGSLLVAPRDAAELDAITSKLAEFNVEPFSNTCIPADMRDQVAVFVAPPDVSFEADDASATEPTGPATTTSTHGLRPGFSGDDRFALFAGPDVPHNQLIAEADAVQVAPTFAKLLGLQTDDKAKPIWASSTQ
jgi:predicted AlkP superfamily pyrophosphatase or phosphodiesterase